MPERKIASLLGIEYGEVIHSILDMMYANAPDTVIQHAMHTHSTVTKLIPTMLRECPLVFLSFVVVLQLSLSLSQSFHGLFLRAARVAAVTREGRIIWVADAHRDDGKRFVVHADEKLTAFIELQSTVRAASCQT